MKDFELDGRKDNVIVVLSVGFQKNKWIQTLWLKIVKKTS